ncbi:MAG TPA: hypothetical protein VFI24_23875 [Pyrinomonadaceae bacterium]|nr:hypothetical protein [Pyrinomonadaceae bacterium]
MNSQHTATRFLLITLTLLFFAIPVFSQGGPPPIDKGRNADRIRQQDQSSREYQLRNFGKEPEAPKDRRQVEALMAQTEEDFTRILTLHNELARAISSKNAIDYHFVSEATAELKKRGTRVQSTLMLKLTADDTVVTEKAEPEFKDSLIKLCKEIRAFVTNPIIENPNTIDAELLTRAKHDLESFIQLSGLIKKDADRLKNEKQ